MPLTPEDRLTAWLRRRVAGRGLDLLGDDAALLPGGSLAVTVDQQLAGVHFPPDLGARAIGRRLVAVNLSDVAAIGGRPAFALLTVAAPSGFATKALVAAVEEELARHGARLAGGDLARSDSFGATLTVLAERTRRGSWVRRSAGRQGDRLWLGGSVGESAAGRLLLGDGATFSNGRARLAGHQKGTYRTQINARRAIRRHLAPTAQLELGAWLARRRRAAAIDVSDGLLLDLDRLCRASGVGAAIDARSLPLSDGFDACAALAGAEATRLALTGGEDYVLLFALPPGITPPTPFDATAIGTLRRRSGIQVTGAETPARRGWDHFAS